MVLLATIFTAIIEPIAVSTGPLSYLSLDCIPSADQLWSLMITFIGSGLGVLFGYIVSDYLEKRGQALTEKRSSIEKTKISARVAAQIFNTTYGFNHQSFRDIFNQYIADREIFLKQELENKVKIKKALYFNFYTFPPVNSQIEYYQKLLLDGTLYDSIPAAIAFTLINSLHELDRAISFRENLINELSESKVKYEKVPESFIKLYFGVPFTVDGQVINWQKFHDNLVVINDKLLDAIYFSICLMEISMKKVNLEIVNGKFKGVELMKLDVEVDQSSLPFGDRHREISKRLNFYPTLLNFET